jgi:hypothetical protein
MRKTVHFSVTEKKKAHFFSMQRMHIHDLHFPEKEFASVNAAGLQRLASIPCSMKSRPYMSQSIFRRQDLVVALVDRVTLAWDSLEKRGARQASPWAGGSNCGGLAADTPTLPVPSPRTETLTAISEGAIA